MYVSFSFCPPISLTSLLGRWHRPHVDRGLHITLDEGYCLQVFITAARHGLALGVIE